MLSIKEVNRELEQILEEIQNVNAITTKDELDKYLNRANNLKEALKSPDSQAESYRFAQAPRSYRNIRDVYNEIIKAANTLVDANIDATAIKKEAMENKKDYFDSLDTREQEVLKVLISGSKGFKGDKHLLELQQKELERQKGGKGQYVSKKEEIDRFLDKIDEVDIDTYEENNAIVVALEELNALKAEIEKLERGRELLKAEAEKIRSEIKKETDIAKKQQLEEDLKTNQGERKRINAEIRTTKEKFKTKAAKFSKSKVFAAKSILLADGNVNLEALTQMNENLLPQAREKRDSATRAIADKLGSQSGLANAMVGGNKGVINAKEIRKYLPSLKGVAPDGIISYQKAIDNMQGIIKDLKTQRMISADLRADIDKIDRDISAIEGNIKYLQARQNTAPAVAVTGRSYFNQKVKTAQEYEREGVTIDQVYLNKSKEEQFEARRKFAESIYPKNARFKGIRSWFRARFNKRDIEYAMSAKKAIKEREEIVLASAYRDTMKVLNANPSMSVEEAQTVALRQMQKREMGREMVDDSATPEEER